MWVWFSVFVFSYEKQATSDVGPTLDKSEASGDHNIDSNTSHFQCEECQDSELVMSYGQGWIMRAFFIIFIALLLCPPQPIYRWQ